MIVDPEEVGQYNGQRCKTNRARQSEKEVKNRNGRGKNKSDGTEDNSAATESVSGICIAETILRERELTSMCPNGQVY